MAHNVCLESWCVKYVYSYAYQKLLEVRKLVSRMKLLSEEFKIIKRLLCGALLINPDVSTFWNMRRELFIEHFLNINTELKFSKLVLTYKSKSNEAFSYRKWLLKGILINEIHDNIRIDNLMNEELLICNMAAQKSQNNYHAWCHRIWCLENILNACSNIEGVLIHELNYSESWISSHVSEHTGFHYRQHVLSRVRNTEIILDKKYTDCIRNFFPNIRHEKIRDILIYMFGSTEQMWNEINVTIMFNSLALLLYELTLSDELNNLFVDHEAIWYHRRYVLHNLLSLICSYFGVHSTEYHDLNSLVSNYDSNIVNCNMFLTDKFDTRAEKCPKMFDCDFNIIKSSNLYKVLMKKEKILLNQLDKKTYLNKNLDLAKRHEKWLRFILGMNEI